MQSERDATTPQPLDGYRRTAVFVVLMRLLGGERLFRPLDVCFSTI